jgi:hypothetical protein
MAASLDGCLAAAAEEVHMSYPKAYSSLRISNHRRILAHRFVPCSPSTHLYAPSIESQKLLKCFLTKDICESTEAKSEVSHLPLPTHYSAFICIASRPQSAYTSSSARGVSRELPQTSSCVVWLGWVAPAEYSCHVGSNIASNKV